MFGLEIRAGSLSHLAIQTRVNLYNNLCSLVINSDWRKQRKNISGAQLKSRTPLWFPDCQLSVTESSGNLSARILLIIQLITIMNSWENKAKKPQAVCFYTQILNTTHTDPKQTADNCTRLHLKVTLKGLIMEFWLRKKEGSLKRTGGTTDLSLALEGNWYLLDS